MKQSHYRMLSAIAMAGALVTNMPPSKREWAISPTGGYVRIGSPKRKGRVASRWGTTKRKQWKRNRQLGNCRK